MNCSDYQKLSEQLFFEVKIIDLKMYVQHNHKLARRNISGYEINYSKELVEQMLVVDFSRISIGKGFLKACRPDGKGDNYK